MKKVIESDSNKSNRNDKKMTFTQNGLNISSKCVLTIVALCIELENFPAGKKPYSDQLVWSYIEVCESIICRHRYLWFLPGSSEMQKAKILSCKFVVKVPSFFRDIRKLSTLFVNLCSKMQNLIYS